MDPERIIICGDNTYKKMKTEYVEKIILYVDRKNDSKENVYFSLERIGELYDSDVFVSYVYDTPLSVRLNHPNIPRDSLVIVTKNNELSEVLSETSHENDDYDLFGGLEILTSKKEIIDQIEYQIKDLFDISYSMMEAGYLDCENNKKIPDWIVMFQDPILKLFTEHHQIETSNPTMNIEDEYLDNPRFRKTILMAMLQILANYIVNNKVVTIEEVSKMGMWTDIETWSVLKSRNIF